MTGIGRKDTIKRKEKVEGRRMMGEMIHPYMVVCPGGGYATADEWTCKDWPSDYDYCHSWLADTKNKVEDDKAGETCIR